MRRAISILSIWGIIAAAILFLFLSTATTNAPASREVVLAGQLFEGFPLNEARFIEFGVDEETLGRLTQRERRDQMLDWLLYTVVSDAGLSVEAISQSLFDIPPIRYGYIHPIANFEYGETRSAYIGNEKVVALVPANSSADQRHDYLAHIADEHRKNLGVIPSTLLIFDYQLEPDTQFALLTRRQEFDTRELYTEDSGYYETEIRSFDDLKRFMNRIDDITFAQADENRLRLGGRKIKSYEYRGIRVEDIAAIWQAEKKIHEELAQFKARWQKKLDELNDRWAGKRFRPEELPEKERQYEEEVKQLQQAMVRERIDRGLVEGSGFSLDPTYDYDGLMGFFKEVEPRLQLLASLHGSPITMQDIEKVKNALAKHAEIRFPEVPFLALADKLSKSNWEFLGERISDLGERISVGIQGYRFQVARYDGDLRGTEVGMILFYTDLLAKLWAIDYMDSAPDQYIEDFKPMTEVAISPIYEREIEELPSTRLWFGQQDKGFQVADDGSSSLFARNATRVYAASSNPLEPGKEVAPNAASAAFLGWWNDHYEEVARYEQEYERLNEIMKWSLLISWLNAANKGHLLGFLKTVQVNTRNWFPEWVQKQPQLKFRKWNEVGFYERGYKGTKTEALPILYSEPYTRFGKDWVLSGGVSLAPKSLFEERKPLSELINELLRRSNLDYGSPGLSNQSLRTYGGVEYTFKNLADNRASVTSRVKDDAKLRGWDAELANHEFECIVSQEPLRLGVETRAGGVPVGTLEISRTESGFKIGWRSREIDVGQSLARRLSKSENLDQILLEDPAVEAMFKMTDEDSYLVKVWGMDSWMKIAPEKESSTKIAAGWQSRVADPEGASQNLLLAWMNGGTVRTELARKGYIVIKSVEGTDKITWESVPLHAPLVSSKELLLEIKRGDITIQGKVDPETGAIYLSWDEFSKTLQDEDYWIGLQKLIHNSDLEQIRKMAASDIPIVQHTIPETRFIDNTRFIRELKTALEHHDYAEVARDIVNNPHEFRTRLAQHLAEEQERSDGFITNGHFVKAIQHVNDLIAIYGPLPELTLRKRIIEIGWHNSFSPQLIARILDGSLLEGLTSEMKDALLENREALRKLDARLYYTKYPQIAMISVTLAGKPVYLLTYGEGSATKVMAMSSEVSDVLEKIEKILSVPIGKAIKGLTSGDRATLRDKLIRPLVEHLDLGQVEEDHIVVDLKGKDFALVDLPNEPLLRAVISYFLRGNRLVGVSAHSTARDVEAKLQARIDLRKLRLVFSLPWSKINWLPEEEKARIIEQYSNEIKGLRDKIGALNKKFHLNINPEEVIIDLSNLSPKDAKGKLDELFREEDSLILSFWEAITPRELEIGKGGRFTQGDIPEAPGPTPESVKRSAKRLVACTGCRSFLTGWPDAVVGKRGVLSLAFWEELSIADAFRFVNKLMDKLGEDPHVAPQAIPLLLEILQELRLPGMPIVEATPERTIA